VLEQTQSEAFFTFHGQHPDVVISQRKFEQLKHYFVKGASERDRRSCLRRKREEARLVFNECIKFRRNVLKEAAHADNPPVPSLLTEAVDLTLCPKPEGSEFHKICCVNRTCDNCGTHLFGLLPKESSEDDLVKWKRFDYMACGKLTISGGQQKIALVQKETLPKELFQYFINLLDTYPHHQFMALWQRKDLDDLLENLPLGHVVCIHDYSESYACTGQNEIQSQYFDVNKASLHITVMFCDATMEAD